jgi:uroporphyrinogen-III synthase
MKSLAGRTIVITRAADQGEATAELVASFDATPVLVPLIEIVDEPAGMSQLEALDLVGVDWLVVTSPNGARRVGRSLAAVPGRLKFAAVGAATAAALPRCDLIAETQSARGLLKLFPPGPGRVVVVQAVDAAPVLVDGLGTLHWTVVAITPYRAATTAPPAEQQRAALAADAVLFASGSAARAWAEIFGGRAPSVAIAIGEQTAAAAERAGLKISATSADHSVYGMLATLNRYFSDEN